MPNAQLQLPDVPPESAMAAVTPRQHTAVSILDAWRAGKSLHTMRSYEHDLAAFAAFLSRQLEIAPPLEIDAALDRLFRQGYRRRASDPPRRGSDFVGPLQAFRYSNVRPPREARAIKRIDTHVGGLPDSPLGVPTTHMYPQFARLRVADQTSRRGASFSIR